MIKMQIIGNLGKDSEVNIHGNKQVINFSVAHTEKYKDSSGTVINKTTWVSCAWWTDKTTIAQYLKKGTQVYVDGQPDVRMWRDNSSGENKCGMTCRVHSVQLLGGKKEEGPQAASGSNTQSTSGYTPVASDISMGDDSLPF